MLLDIYVNKFTAAAGNVFFCFFFCLKALKTQCALSDLRQIVEVTDSLVIIVECIAAKSPVFPAEISGKKQN